MKRKLSNTGLYNNEFNNFNDFSKRFYQQFTNTTGSIYVIKYLNNNNKYKIGRTTDTNFGLVKRYETHLGKNTFQLVYFQKNVKNHEEKEAFIHHLLRKYLINNEREMFKIEGEDFYNLIDKCNKTYRNLAIPKSEPWTKVNTKRLDLDYCYQQISLFLCKKCYINEENNIECDKLYEKYLKWEFRNNNSNALNFYDFENSLLTVPLISNNEIIKINLVFNNNTLYYTSIGLTNNI